MRAERTVEEHLHAYQDEQVQRIQAFAMEKANALRKQLEAFEKEVRGESTSTCTQKSDLTMQKDAQETEIECVAEFVEGLYKGKSVMLRFHPETQKCLIGRSTGKKFQLPYGLSLKKDGEVSTTHAEIRLDKESNTVVFEDLDSTNGSLVNGKPALPGKPVVLGKVSLLDVGVETIRLQILST